ncbi:hypothetical protein IWQ60_009963, partial [Tieghemiomyces parasiticus]
GQNIHRVQLPRSVAARIAGTAAPTTVTDTNPDHDGLFEETLCILPSRFRNTVFIKRGSYIIGNFAGLGEGKVGGEVRHILYPKQIKHLKERGLWPAEMDQPIISEVAATEEPSTAADNRANSSEDDDDDDLFQNSNRRHFADESESDSDSDA